MMTVKEKHIPEFRYRVKCEKCKKYFRIIADKKPTNYICPKCK